MTDQSGLQSFIQKMQGTHTAGQANTPSSVNNGNPNTVYNWSSYKPTVTDVDGRPSVNFDLITSQAPASSPGYATPFTADPYAAMLLAGMPRASSPSAVNGLLGRMFGGSGGGGGGFTPNPGTGAPVTPPTPVSPPSGGTPTGPYAPVGGTLPNLVGPISGPIAANPHNWQANYANANNNSMNARGRAAALPWTALPPSQQGPTGDSSVDGARNALTNMWDSLSNLVGDGVDYLARDFRETFGDLTGERGGLAALRAAANILQPGAGLLIPRGANEPVLTQRELDAITVKANENLSNMLQTIKNNSPLTQEQITAKLNESLQASLQRAYNSGPSSAERIYNSAGQYSPREWQRLQEQFNFANMFQQGRAGDIGQELGRIAEGKVVKTRDKWTRLK